MHLHFNRSIHLPRARRGYHPWLAVSLAIVGLMVLWHPVWAQLPSKEYPAQKAGQFPMHGSLSLQTWEQTDAATGGVTTGIPLLCLPGNAGSALAIRAIWDSKKDKLTFGPGGRVLVEASNSFPVSGLAPKPVLSFTLFR